MYDFGGNAALVVNEHTLLQVMWTSRGQVVCPLGRLDHGTSTEVVGPIFRPYVHVRTSQGKKRKKLDLCTSCCFFS